MVIPPHEDPVSPGFQNMTLKLPGVDRALLPAPPHPVPRHCWCLVWSVTLVELRTGSKARPERGSWCRGLRPDAPSVHTVEFFLFSHSFYRILCPAQ